ncbi:MAG: PAS domain S-box protein, partial [Verrucomicrobia bacterium]|nr:PAS domain S-box protein [Verrucomicrobiota bacterium]
MQPVVGLGGSAGSLSALRAFFSAMPADNGLAFVVVVHLLPDRDSNLAALLQGSTSMPVVQVRDNVEVKPNRVFVIPPGRQLSLADGRLRLSELSAGRGPRVAIDLFFRTLADTSGSQGTAIVLSGADGDGAIGLKRVKERGGLTIAQEPSEAEQDGMPRAAIATGMVDWVLPMADMPGRLLAYYRQEPRLRLPAEEPPPEAAAPSEEAEAALRDALGLLRARTGHDFSDYKRATVLRRLRRRLQVNGLENLPAYRDFLRTHPGEAQALLQDLLISVTNFFRDPQAFAALEAELPRLFAGRKAGDSVRAWVPACATGEEAYSVAMLLAEQAARLPAPPVIQVFATDLDGAALRTAREGLYPETIAADLSEKRLRRFFVKDQGRYRVSRALRETVLFSAHDLLKDAPFAHLNLVSCRNLLIYLNNKAQRRALELFYFALEPAGLLFLGSSETVDDQEGGLFKAMDNKHRLYARGVAPRPVVPVLPAGPSSLAPALALAPRLPPRLAGAAGSAPATRVPGDRPGVLSSAELHLKLREAWGPPSVLVDPQDRVVHSSERAQRYLHWGGEASLEVLRVIHPSLRLELRASLFRARQTGSPVDVTGVLVELADGPQAIDLHVRPAQDLAPGFLLVAFEDGAARPVEGAVVEVRPAAEPLTRQLEAELDQLKLQQRATIEEYEASLEELKSSNEELQAINEELRSATEEVETGREELQSINEELSTVNHELKAKVDELGRANSDLQNLMAATDIATVFLDRELCIQRYTPAAVRLFSLIPSDVGRPLADLSHRLESDFVVADAQRVLETLVPVEREQRSREGRWYLVRLLPYRTLEDRIAGVALTFVDVTARKEAEAALQESEARFRRLSESGIVGIAFFSLRGDIFEGNGAFLQMLGASREDLRAGKVRWDAYTPEAWLSRTRQAVDELRTSGRITPYEKEFVRADGTRRWGLFGGALLADGETGIAIVLDVTDRRRAEEGLRASEAHLRLMMESARDFAIFTLDAQNRITSWNPGAEAICGYTAQEALGQDGRLIFTPEDRAAGQPEQEIETARGEGRAEDERWHLRKDGRRFWASGVLTPMPGPGSPGAAGFLKILRDRTELHEAEQARRYAEQRFSLLARSVRDYAIFLLDPQGRVTHWNEGAARVKGYSE